MTRDVLSVHPDTTVPLDGSSVADVERELARDFEHVWNQAVGVVELDGMVLTIQSGGVWCSRPVTGYLSKMRRGV